MAAYTTIDDSSAHYQGLAYRGDSSSTTSSDRNLTNTGNSDLQPDWIWLFNRDTQLTGGQKIFDSTRGAGSVKVYQVLLQMQKDIKMLLMDM